MDLPSRVPAKLGARVDFRANDFRALVFTRGMDLLWEQAQLCPCRRQANDLVGTRFGAAGALGVKGESSEPRADCTMCKGNGYFWHSGQTVKVLITRASSTPEAYTAWGEMARGMVFLTLLPEHLPTFLDRFTMINSVMSFRESRKRGTGTQDSLRYPIVTRLLDLQTGPTAVDVLHLQKADSTGQTTASDTLVKGVDFAVVDGKIDWTLGDAASTAPAENERYSICYYAAPRYVVTDHPNVYRDTMQKVKTPDPTFSPMLVQAAAKLDFLGDP